MVTSALASRLLQDGLDMHRRGAVAEAAARYSQILTFEPKNVDALCLLGVAKMELKGFPEAVDLLRKVVKLAPKHAPAHNFLGTALKQTGRAEAARDLCEQGLRRPPGEPMLSHLLAAVLFQPALMGPPRGSKRPSARALQHAAARLGRQALR